MGDYLDQIAPLPGLQAGDLKVLKTGHGSEVWVRDSGIQPLPIGHREVDLGRRIKRQTGQVQSKPPVENWMVGEVTEITQAVRARCPTTFWTSVLGADQEIMKHAGLRRLSKDVLEKGLTLFRLSQEGGVPGSVL